MNPTAVSPSKSLIQRRFHWIPWASSKLPRRFVGFVGFLVFGSLKASQVVLVPWESLGLYTCNRQIEGFVRIRVFFCSVCVFCLLDPQCWNQGQERSLMILRVYKPIGFMARTYLPTFGLNFWMVNMPVSWIRNHVQTTDSFRKWWLWSTDIEDFKLVLPYPFLNSHMKTQGLNY